MIFATMSGRGSLRLFWGLFFFVGFSPMASELFAQNYTYEEVYRIMNDENSSEILVNSPKFIVFDHEENMYVGDWQLPEIFKFDPEGRLINKFGARGKGPGEFTEVSAMFFDPSDQEIVVYDRMNMRLTRFTTNGDVTGTSSFPEEKIVSPWMGRTNEKGDIFLLYRNDVMPGAPAPEIDDLIYVFDAGFTGQTSSFVARERFGDIHENDFADRIVGGPTTGFFELVSGDQLIALPYLYTGDLYYYEKVNQEWDLTRILSGDTIVDKHYEQVDYNTAPEYASRIGSSQGNVAGLIYSESTGLCILDEEKLVVFTYQRDEDYIGEFGYSLFNYQSGEFLGYEKIDELSPVSLELRHPVYNITCNQNNSHTYFADYRGEEPEIVAAKIEFEAP